MIKDVNTIIWDWNGTLLADVDICIQAMNRLLEPRQLPLLDLERYCNVFTFPVVEYYKQVGFDFARDPFEKVGIDFIDIYHELVDSVQLANNAVACLEWFKVMGAKQYILSAMEQQSLLRTVSFHGIQAYFEGLTGISDFYGGGKIESGRRLFAQNPINPATTWLIGDTIHDYEVAQELGCKCVLTAHGHQSRVRLMEAGAPVIDNLAELPVFFRTQYGF